MKNLILVDACNLLHRLPAYRKRLNQGIDQLAESLLRDIRCLHDLDNAELHLVVDGNRDSVNQFFPDACKTLSILYSPAGLSADTIIETWLMRLDDQWSVSVASEDRAVTRTAFAHHAQVLSARQLLDWASRVQQRFSSSNRRSSRNSDRDFGNRLEGLT